MQSLQQRASRNPVAITEHFHRRTLCAWDKLLGVSMRVDFDRRAIPPRQASQALVCSQPPAWTPEVLVGAQNEVLAEVP